MPVVYHCPHCHQPVTVPDAMLGQVIGCPHCRNPFQTLLPQPGTPPAPGGPLSLDDEPKSQSAFEGLDQEDTGRSRNRKSRSRDEAQNPHVARMAAAAGVLGSTLAVAVYKSVQKPVAGIDMGQVVIAGLGGGVGAAIGGALGLLFFTKPTPRPEPKSRRRRRRREDDDD